MMDGWMGWVEAIHTFPISDVGVRADSCQISVESSVPVDKYNRTQMQSGNLCSSGLTTHSHLLTYLYTVQQSIGACHAYPSIAMVPLNWSRRSQRGYAVRRLSLDCIAALGAVLLELEELVVEWSLKSND